MNHENISNAVIMEIEIRTARTYYHYISTKMTKNKKTDATKCWQGYGIIGTLI